MEKLAMRAQAKGLIGVSIKGVDCCLAGAENKATKWLETGCMTKEEIAAEVFDFIARTVYRQIEAACESTGVRQALLAGGVASSTHLRSILEKRARKRGLHCSLHFAKPELSGDNAVGVALLGAQAYYDRQII